MKILKEIFKIKRYKREIEEQDRQYEDLLFDCGKLETTIDKCNQQLDREIELKNKYLDSCKKLRIKLKKAQQELKDLKDELK